MSIVDLYNSISYSSNSQYTCILLRIASALLSNSPNTKAQRSEKMHNPNPEIIYRLVINNYYTFVFGRDLPAMNTLPSRICSMSMNVDASYSFWLKFKSKVLPCMNNGIIILMRKHNHRIRCNLLFLKHTKEIQTPY